jgi:hypothetical protein
MTQYISISKDKSDQMRKRLNMPHLTQANIALAEWQYENRTPDQHKAKKELDAMTTEQLDNIAKAFKPKSKYNEEWHQEFTRRALAFAEMFEDGDEVILKAKLQDQLPRMFEKMRDSVQDQAERMLRERQVLVRQDVGIEITGNKLEDHDKKIDQMRQQYASLNDAFHCLLTHFRPMIKGQTGIDFGKYTKLSEFAKVKRMKTRNEKATLDTLINSRETYNDVMTDPETGKPIKRGYIHTQDLMLDISNQDGIIEMPEHLE